MQTLVVDLEDRSYPIYIGQGLLSRSDLISSHVAGDTVLVVTNETVAPLYLDAVLSALAGFKCHQLVLPDGEQFKTLETINRFYDCLLENRCSRDVTIIGLGGGVIGDMSGFAAASYQRGVNFIQVPTTLLSQVDSSVGGKTGVNHTLGKNMIGAFYQPKCVLADISTLKTLPAREFAAGMAEVIKYGLLGDEDFFLWINEHADALMQLDASALGHAIYRSCEIKAEIVASDERESGIRALLNLGHTFGHAIETASGYGTVLHGEAVAIGTVIAARLSSLLGYLDEDDVDRIIALYKYFGLPVSVPDTMKIDDFERYMALDKKVISGSLRLILLSAIGDACIQSDVDKSLINRAIEVSY